jgi:hypothetical protein
MASIFYRYGLIITSLGILAVLSVYLLSFQVTGNVVAQLPADYKVGEELSGELAINIEQNDNLSLDKPLFIALINESNSVLFSKTLTFRELISMDKSGIKTTHGINVPSGKYLFDLSDIVSYKFTNSGEYEPDFTMFDPDIIIRKNINVG